MTNLLLRSNCNFQSGAKCTISKMQTLIEVLQLVFETVYGDKKIGIQKQGPAEQNHGTKVNLPCCKTNLHAPKICAVVQICLWQSLRKVSVVIFHLCTLNDEGIVFSVKDVALSHLWNIN